MAARRFTEPKLVVASHNQGKLREIRDLLAPFSVATVSAGELGLPEPVEDGDTFAANAVIKAHAAATASDLPALADDSGFCLAALDGAPGIYSARWAGANKDFGQAMRNAEEMLQQQGASAPNDRRAWFIASLCLAWPDGHQEIVEGRVDGIAVWPPRGDQGFGYDPMFLPDGETRTFGEMSAAEKHGLTPGDDTGLSHRARAFAKLVRLCFADR